MGGRSLAPPQAGSGIFHLDVDDDGLGCNRAHSSIMAERAAEDALTCSSSLGERLG
jgi:hypothetical protein